MCDKTVLLAIDMLRIFQRIPQYPLPHKKKLPTEVESICDLLNNDLDGSAAEIEVFR